MLYQKTWPKMRSTGFVSAGMQFPFSLASDSTVEGFRVSNSVGDTFSMY